MFVYDRSWQLRSSVQSVESPQGLELSLCQLSSRCPGSEEGQCTCFRGRPCPQVHLSIRIHMPTTLDLCVKQSKTGRMISEIEMCDSEVLIGSVI